MKILENKMYDLSKLCESHEVERLYAFGSVLTENFNEKSDVDFLVKFKPFDLSRYLENYLNLKSKLETLVGRPVDLVEEQTLKNPIFIRSVNRSKSLVYG
jgi:predicted nucleotidyltransferase